MEFLGAEVKSGDTCEVEFEHESLLHLSLEDFPLDFVKAGPSAAKANIEEPKKENDKAKKDDSEDVCREDDSNDKDMVTGPDDSVDEEDDDVVVRKLFHAFLKAQQSKKRSAEAATKTPSEKEAKLVAPLKTVSFVGADGKDGSGGHVATAHPADEAGKTPVNCDELVQKIPNFGRFSCNLCGRDYPTKRGLERHFLLHTSSELRSWYAERKKNLVTYASHDGKSSWLLDAVQIKKQA